MLIEENILQQCVKVMRRELIGGVRSTRAYIFVDPDGSVHISCANYIIGEGYTDTLLSIDVHQALVFFFLSIFEYSNSEWNRAVLTIQKNNRLDFKKWMDDKLNTKYSKNHY